MMFSGIFLKKNSSIVVLAILGIGILLLVNILEIGGTHLFPVNTHDMLYFDMFGLVFNCVAFGMHLNLFPAQRKRYRGQSETIPANISPSSFSCSAV